MNVVFSRESLKDYLKKASEVSREHPVVISKFILNAKEMRLMQSARRKLIVYAISEHVENAGVHSGDATMILPRRSSISRP